MSSTTFSVQSVSQYCWSARTFQPPTACSSALLRGGRIAAVATAVPAVARWVATFGGAETWVTEVIPTAPAGTGLGGNSSEHVRHFAQLLADAGVDASWGMLCGDEPVMRLEEFGTRLRDPIFVATSVRWTDGRVHWRSATRQLVRRSSRPVLVVPADSAARST